MYEFNKPQQFYMSTEEQIVYFDNKALKEKTTNNLKSLRTFSDKEYFQKNIRVFLIKKLDLLKNDFWRKFRQDIFNHIRNHTYVVVRGLPFDGNNRLSVALASIIGIPEVQYNKPRPKIVRRFGPTTGYGYDENYPHTDSVYWPNPTDLLALQCVREDQNGLGKSRIVPIDLLMKKLSEQTNGIVNILFKQKVPFTLDTRFGKTGMHMQYILTRKKYASKYYCQVRFLENDIKECITNFHVRLSKSVLDAIKTFEKEAIMLGKKTEFLAKKGDWVIFDNKRSLHSRSPVSSNSVRILKRIKIDINRKNLYNSQ